jgi:hypothetical protein
VIASDFASALSEFAAIGTSLTNMVEAEKVDLAVIPRIDALLKFSVDREGVWRNNDSVSPQTAFTVYHTWRNLRLVTAKMRESLLKAEQMRENPEAAIQGLKVLPSMLETFTGMVESEGKELSKEERTAILNRVTDLRNAAYHSDMLPSIEEELQETTMENIVEEFDKIAATALRASEESAENSA